MVDVYHEFQKPGPMLEAIRRSLKPTGKVALIEYRLEGTTASHIRPSTACRSSRCSRSGSRRASGS